MKTDQSHRMAALCALLAASLFFTSCGKTAASSAAGSAGQEPASVSSEQAPESPASSEESWKAEFEQSLLENYGVTPEYYEDLGDGVYQVYVKIDGKVVPYVAVDSKTGDYHG